jgi:ABC-type microcin C transport system permease subunit YejB
LQLSSNTLCSWFFIVVDYFWHVMFRIYCYFLGSSRHGFYFSLFLNNIFLGEEIGRDTQMLAPMTTKGILASLGK